MASTITAGNATNGLIISPDNTGILQLKSGTGAGTTALTLDASQNATFAGTLKVNGSTTALYPLVSSTAVASTSGVAIDFTGIPAYAKRITVMFSGVSTNGASVIQIQLGDSGGVETTGYVGGAGNYNNLSQTSVAAISTGFQLLNTGIASLNYYGNVVICLLDTNLWVASGVLSLGTSTNLVNLAGTKTLSATLDRIRITTVNGTDAFDAGTINIMWE